MRRLLVTTIWNQFPSRNETSENISERKIACKHMHSENHSAKPLTTLLTWKKIGFCFIFFFWRKMNVETIFLPMCVLKLFLSAISLLFPSKLPVSDLDTHVFPELNHLNQRSESLTVVRSSCVIWWGFLTKFEAHIMYHCNMIKRKLKVF